MMSAATDPPVRFAGRLRRFAEAGLRAVERRRFRPASTARFNRPESTYIAGRAPFFEHFGVMQPGTTGLASPARALGIFRRPR